jgi:ribosomal protein L12E/L44/L45/RPP1/RPP2
MARGPKPTALDQQTEYEKVQQTNIAENEKLLLELMGGDMNVDSGMAMAISTLGIAPATSGKRKKAAAKPKKKKEVAVKPKKEEDGEDGEDEKVSSRPALGTRRSARNAGKPATSYAGNGDHISDRTKMPVIVSQPGKRWDDEDSSDDDGERADRGGGTVRVNKLVGRVHDP